MKETKQTKKGTNPAGKSRYRMGPKLGFVKVPEGYKARWVENTEEATSRRQEEGFEYINRTKFPAATHVKTGNGKDVKDQAESGSHYTYRELVAMMIPIEDLRGDGQCLVEREKLMRERAEHDFKSRISTKANQHAILGGTGAGDMASIAPRMEVERIIYN